MIINHNNKKHFTILFQIDMMRRILIRGTGGAVMTKLIANSIKNATGNTILFNDNSNDTFYNKIKNGTLPWSEDAKKYWQSLYEQHQPFLDDDFALAIAKDSFSRLWELTVVHFLNAHSVKGVKLIKISKKSSIPDFCIEILDKLFYVEAICVSPGTIATLQAPLTKTPHARTTPVAENMERLTAAIREKGHSKYYGEKACGYKCAMENNSGLILAISMSKIDLNNRSNNFEQDLRCIYGFTNMQIPIERDLNSTNYKFGKPYYEQQASFEKVSNKSPEKPGAQLKMNYFASEEYSHISAILLSYDGCAFFPALDQYVEIRWKKCRNDFILIHNPCAKIKLPVGAFDASLEVTASISDGEIIINIPNQEETEN